MRRLSSRVARLGVSILLSLVMTVGLGSGALAASPTDPPPSPTTSPVVTPAQPPSVTPAARPKTDPRTRSESDGCMPAGWDPTLLEARCATQGGRAVGTKAAWSPATAGGWAIKGTVTGTGGSPLANASISLKPLNADYFYPWTATASDGTYTASVAPGIYSVRVEDPSGTFLNGYYNSASSGHFTLDSTQATPVDAGSSDVTGISVQLGTGHNVQGIVTGSGGTPLAGVEVDVYSNGYYGFGSTQANGSWSVDVPSGVYSVAFWGVPQPYVDGYYDSGSPGSYSIERNSATQVSVGSSDVAGINVQLRPGHFITGTVTAPGGAPLANIEVNAWTSAYQAWDWATAANGTYSVLVPGGSYEMYFTDTSGSYLNGYYNSSAGGHFSIAEGSATLVNVTSADVAGISVQLGTGFHIKGRVTDQDGQPIAGASVGPYSSSYSGEGTTAADGTYSVTVPAGSYSVDFWVRGICGDYCPTGYLPGYYSSGGLVIDYGKATPVVVGSGDVSGIDVTMWPAGDTYHALTPTRLLDTRYGTGLAGAFTSHQARTFQVAGTAVVPARATAVTGNLTVTGQTSLGYLYIGPNAADNPTSSTLNFPVGDDRANAVTVALSKTGTLSVTYATPNAGATAHVIFDVTGFFTDDTSGATYHALTPARILDSRDGTGGLGTFSSHVSQTFTVTGHGDVPANAVAVTGNLTITQQTSLGYLFVGPVAMNNPTSSTLNFPTNDDRANAVTVALGAGGSLSITYAAPTSGPTAHVIFDVTGYFTPDMRGAGYVALTPTRLLDTRSANGLSGAFGSHVARPFQVTGRVAVPAFAIAVTGNLTVTAQTSLGYLYIGPAEKNNPTSSTLNFPLKDDRANAVTVALNIDGSLAVTYAAPIAGPTADVIFDVTGYFVSSTMAG
jgi:Carboxypeptidase regulatory-like domain